MNPYWANLLAWTIQVTIVTAVGAALPTLFRLMASRARLWYWHVLLLACLALPLVQPWVKPAPSHSNVTFTTGQFQLAANQPPAGFTVPWPTVALVVLLGGIALRMLWLAIGLLRLRHYRASAMPVPFHRPTIISPICGVPSRRKPRSSSPIVSPAR